MQKEGPTMTIKGRCVKEFQEAAGKCISSMGAPKESRLSTGVEALGSITRGITTADVAVLIGEVGSGKSRLLRRIRRTCSFCPLDQGNIAPCRWFV